MANRYKVSNEGAYPHFITTSIVRWYPVFISESYIRIVLDSLEHLRRERGLAIYAYVIMPTHIHAILAASDCNLSAIMRDFKKFTSRSIYEVSQREGNRLQAWLFEREAESESRSHFKVWQDEFHPEVIHKQEFFIQKADYIHANPVRKGLAQTPSQWYNSSAGIWYGDGISPIAIDYLEW